MKKLCFIIILLLCGCVSPKKSHVKALLIPSNPTGIANGVQVKTEGNVIYIWRLNHKDNK